MPLPGGTDAFFWQYSGYMADDEPLLPYLRRADGGSEDEEITPDTELYSEYRNRKDELHREDGPALDFGDKDPRNRFFLDGKEVTESDVTAYRQAKEQVRRMKKSWEDEQIRQLTEGTARPIKVRGPLKVRKP